jgi:hypothetical protein
MGVEKQFHTHFAVTRLSDGWECLQNLRSGVIDNLTSAIANSFATGNNMALVSASCSIYCKLSSLKYCRYHLLFENTELLLMVESPASWQNSQSEFFESVRKLFHSIAVWSWLRIMLEDSDNHH